MSEPASAPACDCGRKDGLHAWRCAVVVPERDGHTPTLTGAEAMSAETERTEGYIIRWPWEYPAKKGDTRWRYQGDAGEKADNLENADVMSLQRANRDLRKRPPDAEIVRVCRVKSEDHWEFASDGEAEGFGYGWYRAGEDVNDGSNPPYSFSQRVSDKQASLFKRIPGQSRWEVCDDE